MAIGSTSYWCNEFGKFAFFGVKEQWYGDYQFRMQVANNKEMTRCGLERKKGLGCMGYQKYGVLVGSAKEGECVSWP